MKITELKTNDEFIDSDGDLCVFDRIVNKAFHETKVYGWYYDLNEREWDYWSFWKHDEEVTLGWDNNLSMWTKEVLDILRERREEGK